MRKPDALYIGHIAQELSSISSSAAEHLNMSDTFRPGWDKPLDDSLYAPDEEEKNFMKETTGIQDDEKLKQHIIAVQSKAFAVSAMPSQ